MRRPPACRGRRTTAERGTAVLPVVPVAVGTVGTSGAASSRTPGARPASWRGSVAVGGGGRGRCIVGVGVGVYVG